VTVALSGDGGDELFGGYNRYFWGPRIWQRLTWLPYPARRTLGQALLRVPTSGWDGLLAPNKLLQPHGTSVRQFGDKLHKLAERLRTVQDIDGLYRSLVSEWSTPAELLRASGVHEPASLLDDPFPDGLHAAPLRMMYRDSQTYLPDDILCKVDRAAMAVSLETRVPLLDHRVFELAWRLPLSMKIRDNRGKWALRRLLAKHLPTQLIDRPKAGFALPIGDWLRGPLRGWAEELLDERQLRDDGLLNSQPIRQAWTEHLNGRRDWTPRLWSVLMLQAWRRNGS
jgi:asparagine synthase (glutamine-hydrolysing)